MRTIPVSVVGGYLGAGKTTLINHLLSTTQQRLAVLVNDFGDINIDVDLIASHDGETLSLANGCICCSLVDGFASALETVLAVDPPPERIVVETSGVADPATVAAYSHGNGLRPDATIVVADAEQIRRRARDEYVGDTVLGQLRSAEVLVLNKADLVEAAALDACREWLRTIAPDAAVIEASHARVDEALLFDLDLGGADRGDTGAAESPNVAPHVADGLDHRTWTITSAEPMTREALDAVMDELGPEVVRAKGPVWLADEPDTRMLLQRVGARWTLEPLGEWPGGASPATSVVVIATQPRDRDNAQ